MQKLARDLKLGDCFVIRYGTQVFENDVDQITVYQNVDDFEDYFGPLEGFFIGDGPVTFPLYYVLSFDVEANDYDEFYFMYHDVVEVTNG